MASASVLLRIKEKRVQDVAAAKQVVPIQTLKDKLDDAPALIDFAARLRENMPAAIIAEIKRASPSKGDIFPDANAAEVASRYASAGAAAISVLTEPTWFKGTLEDMLSARQTVANLKSRPAILRKDFIIDEYQVYETRVFGADTLLLIVAILSDDEIKSLLHVSRSLGMEPLVEVATTEEMTRAAACGARVVGINNRNLHNFTVDLTTTERVVASAGTTDILMVALSGISSRVDVQRFRCAGVNAFLVGEALMRAANPAQVLCGLRGVSTNNEIPLVKVCGCMDKETAVHAVRSGADMIGLVFATSKRKVEVEVAKQIGDAVRQLLPEGRRFLQAPETSNPFSAQVLSEACSRGPLVVGVFADQPLHEVLQLATQAQLDIVQLSGGEDLEFVKSMVLQCASAGMGVVKAVHVRDTHTSQELADRVNQLPESCVGLLDTQDPSMRGGTGRAFNWEIATELAQKHKKNFFLAGGLSPTNVHEAVSLVTPFAVDVSSGVETDGKKDWEKIAAFVQQAKLVEEGLIR